MDVRYFEIIEWKTPYTLDRNTWFVPYVVMDIPDSLWERLWRILLKTTRFRAYGIKLEHGVHFSIPEDGSFFTGEFSREILENFVNEFSAQGREPAELDEIWRVGEISFVLGSKKSIKGARIREYGHSFSEHRHGQNCCTLL